MNKDTLQMEAMKSVRKHNVFVGRAYGTAKGARGYDRKREKRQWKEARDM